MYPTALPRLAVEKALSECVLTLIGNEQVMRKQYVLGDNKAEELANVQRLKRSLQMEVTAT